MGGNGSGRMGRRSIRATVEDCRVLDVNRLAREGAFAAGSRQRSLVWRNTRTQEVTSSAGCTCVETEGCWTFTLIYAVLHDGEKLDVQLPVPLEMTYPRLGGYRWWFRCPLTREGQICLRRVGKLYLPPGALYFGCRHCHDLTYASCRESHKYDGVYRRLADEMGLRLEDVRRVLERWARRR